MRIYRLVPRKPIYIGQITTPAELVAALKAAVMERKPDAALVEQYRRGVLEMLAAVHGVRRTCR